MIQMPFISVLFHFSQFKIMAMYVSNTHTTLIHMDVLLVTRSKMNYYLISWNLNNEKIHNIHNLMIHVHTKFDVDISGFLFSYHGKY